MTNKSSALQVIIGAFFFCAASVLLVSCGETEPKAPSSPSEGHCTDTSCPEGCCAGNSCMNPSDETCGWNGSECMDCTADSRSDSCVDGACICQAEGVRCDEGIVCDADGCLHECIPSCEGKCPGADDGCGGFCEDNDCAGCCKDTDCIDPPTNLNCGIDGEACVSCFPQICTGDGTCKPADTNDAEFVSQTVPSSMDPSSTVQVSLFFRNTGTTDWTEAAHYRLGSQSPQDNNNWGLGRVHMDASETVSPGETIEFSFEVTAPAEPGIYDFRWRMVECHEEGEWFGEFSPLIRVAVGIDSYPSPQEFLGRGLFALPRDGGIYLGWRLLPWDSPDVGFNVYRTTNLKTGTWILINDGEPVVDSTNYKDGGVTPGSKYYYKVRPVEGGVEGSDSSIAQATAGPDAGYIGISLAPSGDEARDLGRFAVGDLNGNGVMDFVLHMYENSNCDLWGNPPATTSHVEALLSKPDGTWESAWRIDTGFHGTRCDTGEGLITVWDLNGNGRAEVVVRMTTPEGGKGGLAVLDGLTGEVIATAPWPHPNWLIPHTNYVAIGLLEDINGNGTADPFIVLNSGGYGAGWAMFSAYRLFGSENLVKARHMEIPSEEESGVWGMGTHGLLAADLNGDGFDDIIPCGSIIKPDWSGYWIVNNGHCDVCFVGSILEPDPDFGGAQLFMGCERGGPNGHGESTLVERIGNNSPSRLWTEPTIHCEEGIGEVDKGWCAHLTDEHPGMECGVLEFCEGVSGTNKERLFNSLGQEIFGTPFHWAAFPVDWERGDQRNKILFLQGHGVDGCGTPLSHLGSRAVDLIGDSREEIVSFCRNGPGGRGELRIFTNTNLNSTRHVTPLADRGYRHGVARIGTGYATNYVLAKTNQHRIDIVPKSVD